MRTFTPAESTTMETSGAGTEKCLVQILFAVPRDPPHHQLSRTETVDRKKVMYEKMRTRRGAFVEKPVFML